MSPVPIVARRLALPAAAALLVTLGTPLSAPPADAAVTMPGDNQLRNGSFERSLDGWGPTRARLTRTTTSSAPHGHYVAKATWSGATGTLAVTSTPKGSPLTASGARYAASVYVQGATAGARAHRSRIVLRETDASGALVRATYGAWVTTTSAFRRLTATTHGVRSGDRLRVQVQLAKPGPDAVLRIDAASLRARAELPVTNALSNATFRGTTGWAAQAGTLTSLRSRQSPDGGTAGRLVAAGTTPAAVMTTTPRTTGAPATWRGSAWLAASTGTRGDTARLVLEERTGGAVTARYPGPTVTLGRGFTQASFSHVVSAGSTVALVVELSSPAAGDALLVDAASLAAAGPTVGLLAISDGAAAQLGDTSRYRLIVLHQPDHPRIAAIRAASPETRVMVYLDPSATRRRDCTADAGSGPSWSSDPASFNMAVDYCWVQAHHPEWILRTADGDEATFADYPEYVVLDPGNPDYRRQVVDNAITAATRDGDFDGVYLDDVNTSIGHGLGTTALYRSRDGGLTPYDVQGYGDDVVELVDAFRTGMEADATGARLLRMANVYADPWSPTPAAQAKAIAADLDIFNREHQAQWLGGGYCGPYKAMQPDATWAIHTFARQVQSAGTSYSGVEYGSSSAAPTSHDRAMMRFSRATWLLSWNGRPGGAAIWRPCMDPARPAPADDPDWVTELGLPTSGTSVVRSGEVRWYASQNWTQTARLLRRRFTDGIVLSSTFTTPQTVRLDGTYRDTAGVLHTGSITLPAAEPASSPYDGVQQGLSGTAVLLTRVHY